MRDQDKIQPGPYWGHEPKRDRWAGGGWPSVAFRLAPILFVIVLAIILYRLQGGV